MQVTQATQATQVDESSSLVINVEGKVEALQNSQPPSYADIFRSYPANAQIAIGTSHAANGLAVVILIPVIPLMGSCWNFTGGCVPGYVLFAIVMVLVLIGRITNNVGNEIMAHNKAA